MGRGRGTVVAVVLGAALAAVVPSGAVTGPVTIVGGPEDQFHPSVDDSYLVWTQNSEASPNVDHAYARPFGDGARFRLDARGTRGDAGGIDPASGRAIYEQATDRTSDLFWFDLDARQRTKVSADGVNTRRRELDPRVSATFLFFARRVRSTTSLFLYHRADDTVTGIASYDVTRFSVEPGAVGDRYAAWSVCGPLTCSVWWYDTQDVDGQPRRLPTFEGRPQYAPVIDEVGGYIYFVRSGTGCGASVGVWRRAWPLDPDRPPERLVSLPGGIDTGLTLSLDRDVANERVDLWFSRYRCASDQGDVVELRDVETVP